VTENVYALDEGPAAELVGAVRRVRRETREGYNLTPLDGFAYRAADNTGVTVEVTGALGTSGAGNGLHAGLLRFSDTAASPPTWNDVTDGVVWVLPAPTATHAVGEVIGNARLTGVASDGRPIFTGGGGAGAAVLVVVTGYDAGTRYHTVRRKTWLGTPGDVADYAPTTTYTTCRASARSVVVTSPTRPEPEGAFNYRIPDGTLCYMTAIPDKNGDYWIEPTGDYATATTPGLLSTYDQVKSGNLQIVRGVATASDPCSLIVGKSTETAHSRVAVRNSGGSSRIEVGGSLANPAWTITTEGDSVNGVPFPGPTIKTEGANGHLRIESTVYGLGVSFYAHTDGATGIYGSPDGTMFAGVGATGPLAGGLEALVLQANRGYPQPPPPPNTSPTPCYAVRDPAGWFVRSGIWGDRTINDRLGGTHQVEISGGIVTRWVAPGGGPVAVNGAPQTLEAGKTYYADGAAEEQFYLSPLARAGDQFRVVGRGTGGWKINQRAGQTIRTAAGFSTTATTTGAAGNLNANQWAAVSIECVNDGTDFILLADNGNLTWV
jgi:hypothetical protein